MFDNKIALNYLLAEQGGVCAMTTPSVPELTLLEKLKVNYRRTTGLALKGAFQWDFDLFAFDWFESWDHSSKVHLKYSEFCCL